MSSAVTSLTSCSETEKTSPEVVASSSRKRRYKRIPKGSANVDTFSSVIQPFLQKQQADILSLQSEISKIKQLQQASPPPNLCSGLNFLFSLLLTITFIAVIGLVLSILAWVGVIPQLAAVLGISNIIWLVVGSGIVGLVSFVCVISLVVYSYKQKTVILNPAES